MAVIKIKESTQKRSLREASKGTMDYTIWILTMDVAVPDGSMIVGATSADGGKLFRDISSVLKKHGYEMAGDYIDAMEDKGATDDYKNNDYEFFLESARKLREAKGMDYTIWILTMEVAVPRGSKVTGFMTGTPDPAELYDDINAVLKKHGYEMAGDYIDAAEDKDATKVYKDNDYEFFVESLEDCSTSRGSAKTDKNAQTEDWDMDDDDIDTDHYMTIHQINKELDSVDKRYNDVRLTNKESDDMYQAGYTLGTSKFGTVMKAARKDYDSYKSGKDVNGNPIKRDKDGRVVKVIAND